MWLYGSKKRVTTEHFRLFYLFSAIYTPKFFLLNPTAILVQGELAPCSVTFEDIGQDAGFDVDDDGALLGAIIVNGDLLVVICAVFIVGLLV